MYNVNTFFQINELIFQVRQFDERFRRNRRNRLHAMHVLTELSV